LKLSIVIPVFNEESTISELIKRVLSVDYEFDNLEIVIVDDASSDNSWEIIRKLAYNHEELNVFRHKRNHGKGAAIRTGFLRATGDILIIQDADLEYNPSEIPSLVNLIRNDIADVVYGSRFHSIGPHRVLYYWHSIGNRFLTLLSNMFTGINLTDIEVCYKAFHRKVLDTFTIEESRFGIEPEITAKVAKGKWRVFEVPISYYGRTYTEGKKIGWKDGLRALYCIIKYNLFR